MLHHIIFSLSTLIKYPWKKYFNLSGRTTEYFKLQPFYYMKSNIEADWLVDKG